VQQDWYNPQSIPSHASTVLRENIRTRKGRVSVRIAKSVDLNRIPEAMVVRDALSGSTSPKQVSLCSASMEWAATGALPVGFKIQ
jgi:hypothetical protein